MITAEINGITLTLRTDPELFPLGTDRWTLAILKLTEIDPGERGSVVQSGKRCHE